MKKILFMLVLMVGCIFVNIADTSAQEIQEVNVLNWTSVNNSSLRAIRNNFDFTVPYNAGYVADVSMPETGNFKYIRVSISKTIYRLFYISNHINIIITYKIYKCLLNITCILILVN